MSYEYEYPHPAVTVDVVVFTIENDDLKVLLIERDLEPFEGQWALPGGFQVISYRSPRATMPGTRNYSVRTNYPRWRAIMKVFSDLPNSV